VETIVQTFSDLVRDRLTELQINAYSAENAAGLPPDAIRNVLRSEKQAGPTLSRMKQICDALGLEIRIAPRHEMVRLNEAEFRNIRGAEDAPTGFLTIPWAEQAVGAGSAPVCFARHWLDAQGLKVDFLKAVLPDVFEIEGAIPKDGIAVIDSRAGLRKGHGLWSYRWSGREVVGHITFAGGVTVLHSASLQAEPTILEGAHSGKLELRGKVVWIGQSIPLKGKVG
jgi:hypothetical protein